MSADATDRAARSPRVAFGLAAMSAAMMARCEVATLDDASELVDAARACLPDEAPLRAALSFRAALADGPQVAAGDMLWAFLDRYCETMAPERAVLAARTAGIGALGHAWQTRADCGHD